MQYSADDRAAALVALEANGGNIKRTSRDTGIPPKTLRRWSGGGTRDAPHAPPRPRVAPQTRAPTPERVAEARASLEEKLEHIAYALAEAIPGKIEDASLKDASVSLAIAVDKLRLLRGEATEVTEVRQSDAKRELAERLQRLASGPPGHTGPAN